MSRLDAAASADLVRRIAAGEEGAEAELLERCGRTLRFLARRHARDAADAEDLFQETLMLALEKIRRQEVREPERLGAFLGSLLKKCLKIRHQLGSLHWYVYQRKITMCVFVSICGELMRQLKGNVFPYLRSMIFYRI